MIQTLKFSPISNLATGSSGAKAASMVATPNVLANGSSNSQFVLSVTAIANALKSELN